MRIKISKKEAKESRFWILLTKSSTDQNEEKRALAQEATELMNILGAILNKNSE